ncbi:MAG: sigma-E factor negative regulatory protein [Pseudomonadota bacterium]
MSQDNMSKDGKISPEVEATSAFFDGEVADCSSLDDWLDNTENTERWHRYSIISSSLKGDLAEVSHIDISAKVSAAVNDESSAKVVHTSFSSRSAAARKAAARWLQPAGKAAVAAGVAVVAVLTVQTYQQPASVPSAEEPAFMTAPIGGRQPVSYSPSTNTGTTGQQQQQTQDSQLRRQAQSYLIDHQQQLMIVEGKANKIRSDKNESSETQQKDGSQ